MHICTYSAEMFSQCKVLLLEVNPVLDLWNDIGYVLYRNRLVLPLERQTRGRNMLSVEDIGTFVFC